jgi:hypothetical protein
VNEENVFELEAQNKKLTAEQKKERQKDIDDIRKVLKTPEGRRLFWRLLSKCGIFRNSFNLNSNQTAFCEGQRNIGLELLNEINEADITAFSRMQNEYLSALNSKKQAKETEENARTSD